MFGGVTYGKKALRKKQEQRQRQGQINRIRNVKPNGVGWSFYEQPRALNNGKKNMILEDKCTEIQRENRMLLEKINNTRNKRAQTVNQRERGNRSLNGSFRRKQLQNIEVENARLLKRLQEKRSSYQTDKLKEDWKKQKAVIKNIANYPFVIKDKLPKHKRRSYTKPLNLDFDRPVRQDIEMMRIRNLGGVTMVITVRINSQQLTVLGDIKGSKGVKIIEIPREQALQFIEMQCEGKLENIFDRLQYDQTEGVLYLLSQQAQYQELPPEHPTQQQK